MIRLAANLSFLFTELPFLDRIEAAAECGFRGVECMFPYGSPADAVVRRCAENGVGVVLFNAPPGDWEAGDRGLAAIPARVDEFRASLDQALAYAVALDCPRIHVMAGLCDASGRTAAQACYCDNLAYAGDRAERVGAAITIEPINSYDMPGYFLNSLDTAMDVLRSVDHPAVGLQFDFYHQQIIAGDLTRSYTRAAPLIRHVQIAGAPHRNEPDAGECDPHYLLRMANALGYDGWVGCEYRPRGDTRAGLGWAAPYLVR